MNIQLCDLKQNYLNCKRDIDKSIKRVIGNTSYILGKEVKEFEEEYSNYCRVRYCAGVSNATSGLCMILQAIGVNQNSEIIIPTYTVASTIESVLMSGAKPVLCDVGNSGNLLVETIRNKITENTMAIVAIHMYGNPCDIEGIINLAKEKHIYVIEDCSHAHGINHNGKKLGTFGDAAVFSFFPSKILGCFGDGGAVVTNNRGIHDNVCAIRNHGRINGEKYNHSFVGRNSRLDGLQAAILRAKLKYLDSFVECRKSVAKRYNQAFYGIVNVLNSSNCGYYVYPIFYNDRDDLAIYLRENEIKTGMHYPIPLHKMPPYKDNGEYPVSDKISDLCLSLPMYPELAENDQDYVIENVIKFVSGRYG